MDKRVAILVFRRVLLVLAAFITLTQWEIRAQERVLTLQYGPLETFRETLPISSSIVIGLQIGDLSNPFPTGQYSAILPREWAGETVCLTIKSGDGRYDAEAEYNVPEVWEGGQAGLPFPTRFDDFLSSKESRFIATLVRRGDCTGHTDEYALFAVDNFERVVSNEPVIFTLNTLRADETFLVLPDGTLVECNRINDDTFAAFDTECTLTGSLKFIAGETIEIHRIRGGRLDRVYTAKLYVQEP